MPKQKSHRGAAKRFSFTKTGIVKKTPLMEFSNVRKNGLTAINLREEDELIEVKITDSNTWALYGEAVKE